MEWCDLLLVESHLSDMSGKARLFLVLPVAIMDAFFIVWILKSLSATLNKLQARRMMSKLDIYRKFTNALVVVFDQNMAAANMLLTRCVSRSHLKYGSMDNCSSK